MPAEQSPEKRSERVTIACTPTEKAALELIATVRYELYNGEASTVLREYTPSAAVEYAERIRSAVGPLAATGAGAR